MALPHAVILVKVMIQEVDAMQVRRLRVDSAAEGWALTGVAPQAGLAATSGLAQFSLSREPEASFCTQPAACDLVAQGDSNAQSRSLFLLQ